VSVMSSSCLWLILAPKMFQLCTNELVLVLCRLVWVVEACQFFLVPSRSSNTPLYPSKVLQTRQHAPTPYFSIVFSLDSHLSPSRSWEHAPMPHLKLLKNMLLGHFFWKRNKNCNSYGLMKIWSNFIHSNVPNYKTIKVFKQKILHISLSSYITLYIESQ